MHWLALSVFLVVMAIAAPLAAQERITLAAEDHDGHGRMILTFPDRMSLPPYRVVSENGVLAIILEEPIAGTLPDVPLILDGYIAVSRMDPDGRGVRFGLKGPLQAHTMEAGEALYVDLLPADWVGLPPGLPQDVVEQLARRAEEAARLAEERRRAELAAEYDPRVQVRVGRHPTFTRVVFDWTVGTGAEWTHEDDQATIRFNWPVAVDLYPLLSDLPAELTEVDNRVNPGDSVVAIGAQEGAGLRFYEQSPTQFILDIDRADAPDLDGDLEALVAALARSDAEAADEGESAAAAQPLPAVARADSGQEAITPFVTAIGSTVRIVFPFEDDTASAVFKRGDTIWMLFDTSVSIRPPERGGDLDLIARDFSAVGAGDAQVVRLELNGDHLATLGSEGRGWVLSVGDILLNATEPVTLDRRRTQDGRFEIFANLDRPARVHQLRDPQVGDTLDVITAHAPARGLVRELDYVDFSAMRSVHGLVIKPHHDMLDVGIEDRLVVLSSAKGLRVSSAADRRVSEAPVVLGASHMDLGPLLARNPVDFDVRRNALMEQATGAEGRELDRMRLDTARLYLANNLSYEALGVLSVTQAELRQSDLDAAIAITRGAANALAGRSTAAMQDLTSDRLRDETDTMIWRTIARAQMQDYELARLDALGAEDAVGSYPNWVRSRFFLAGIESAVALEDSALALRLIGKLDYSALDREQVSRLELMMGRLAEIEGRLDEALETYGRVIAADIRPTRAEAVLATIRLLDRMGRLDPDRAAETLAVHAAIWRGDHVEMEMLKMLTQLRLRNGEYRAAFSAVREISAIFGTSPNLEAIVEQARLAFHDLYINGAADALEPIEALSLYYDFRHLTPAGVQGDMMIRNLAQRLVKVDLLAQAADLLEYQVDNRLQGAARSQVAADLAVIHIANRAPEKALRALYRTRLAGLPPAQDRQRRVLEARALIDANRQDLALDLLRSVAGRDTDILRIDALWRGQRYREAGEMIELLHSNDLARGPLPPNARMNVVRAAVGYVLANDRIGLTRLRAKFSNAMASTPEWPLFAYVTDEIEIDSVEFRQVARQIGAQDSLNAFLSAYRDIYLAESALTPMRASGDDDPGNV